MAVVDEMLMKKKTGQGFSALTSTFPGSCRESNPPLYVSFPFARLVPWGYVFGF
jgi:hypothetical protein